ncbi:MAG: NPCBM/NEW2 domain-containing protein [Planctomyces sp.]|nr:NPCBM/NEW2 domain-containing protein [Planctomyces sp.]
MKLNPVRRAILLIAVAFAFVPAVRAEKPVAVTPVVTTATPKHAVPIKADIAGAKNLYLVVTDGGNGFGCDWADWAEPVLTGPKGRLPLTELKWKSADSQWGKVHVNGNAAGEPLKIAGEPVKFGIGTHANSVIHYELPEGYQTFEARCGLDNGGTDQGEGGASSVQFFVFTAAPPASPSEDRSPESAVAALDVADGVETRLFAAEPMLLSPSNIDVDHLGRVWVCEVVNYRRFANGNNPDRPEGDRILVLEDTDHDGVADKQTVFYQGRDIDSAHGVCVLGDRVIVSAGDSVFSFYDDNMDLKSDRKEVLFTGIKGTQHDHGIHSFTFGPDGRLYFNFGNSGEELHTPDGAIVKDLAGNEVRAARQPYQEGMAFRCELDGSKVETLGWNFRNNWELCVDSFGSIWQSDNDDDGNRGVRINYVMEFGNYGYKDEITGAGWTSPRTNLELEVPHRHWHLNDPGVVPNVLQTGAGSPTGILIYEGDQLPERFLNQLIHCDAGPNVVRSYATIPQGAGYAGEINNLLNGTRDQWFRPSDVCVAPDGSLIVADWYDPGVGGHRQGDVDRGRLFRVSLPGKAYQVPTVDLETIEGAAQALLSPNVATRYLAYQKLLASGAAAEPVLKEIFETNTNPRFRARALWLLGQIDGKAQQYIDMAIADSNADIRITGLRMARRLGKSVSSVIEKLSSDESLAVRRECCVALRHLDSDKKPAMWARLAAFHDGQDRWYLEALGIAAGNDWDRCLAAYLKLRSTRRDLPPPNQMEDIIWRSRAKNSSEEIAKKIVAYSTGTLEVGASTNPAAGIPGMFRALDFQDADLRAAAVRKLLAGDAVAAMKEDAASEVIAESLQRIGGDISGDPDAAAALAKVLEDARGTSRFIQLVRRFSLSTHYPDILLLAQEKPTEQLGVEAISALLDLKQNDLIVAALRSDDPASAVRTAEALGSSSQGAIADPLLSVIADESVAIDVRRACVRAAARVNNGAAELVRQVEHDLLDGELTQAVAAALHASPSRAAREQAMRLFPLPPSKDNKPTPPVSELLKLDGKLANGRAIFFSTGTCHKCHVVDGMGREIGPNLTEIGSKLSRDAMFESILYPSAGISHNYEAWTVVLASGTTVTGLLTSQTDESISLKGDDAIVREFKRSDVEELVKQKVSMMPADLQKTMTTQELADVVEFMQSLKKKD